MHSYLRAIGFEQFHRKKDLDPIIQKIIIEPECKTVIEKDGIIFAQLDQSFGNDFGISVFGEYDEEGNFDISYYVPYFQGFGMTTYEKPAIERHAARESYAGMCDDFRVGISIIFYVNNVLEYKKAYSMGMLPEGIALSGLACQGMVLLPVNKSEKQKQADREAVEERIQLITAAREGDEKAIESLTLEDLDIFTMVGRRIGKEDVLSIVESYFMPRGIECDQYTVLGEIIDVQSNVNVVTNEQLYIVTLNCNEMIFDICINEVDLLGEPIVGRRMKADIWLQGSVRYMV